MPRKVEYPAQHPQQHSLTDAGEVPTKVTSQKPSLIHQSLPAITSAYLQGKISEWRPNGGRMPDSQCLEHRCSASTYGPEVVPQRLETGICAFHRHSIRIASINQVNCHQIYPWHQRISKCDWFVSSHFRCSCASSSRHRAMLDLL